MSAYYTIDLSSDSKTKVSEELPFGWAVKRCVIVDVSHNISRVLG